MNMGGMTKNCQCLVLIPARGGSKGIPRKNMASLGGKPLIEYTIQSAINANLLGRICLSTDDEEIRNFGLEFSIEAPFLRPASLAMDNSETIPVILHALEWYEKNERFFPKFVVLLQPTCPFRSSDHIVNSFNQIVESNADSLISVNPVREHPCEYVLKGDMRFEYVLAPPEKPGRQNFPEIFFINGAIYISAVSLIKERRILFDRKAIIYEMELRESIDIDEPDDLEYANWLITRN